MGGIRKRVVLAGGLAVAMTLLTFAAAFIVYRLMARYRSRRYASGRSVIPFDPEEERS